MPMGLARHAHGHYPRLMRNETTTDEDLSGLDDFAFLTPGTVPCAPNPGVSHVQARAMAACPLVEPTPAEVTKSALVTEVKARSLKVIEEYDRNGYAYIYVNGPSGWYRFTARKFRRLSSDLNAMIWEASKLGHEFAVCPVKPMKEVA